MKQRLMLTVWTALWIALAAVRGADDGALRASKPEVRKEVVAIIEAQLGAFRAKDSTKAYSYSAAAMQQQTHDDADREAHAAYARPPPHHGGVVGDAGKDI